MKSQNANALGITQFNREVKKFSSKIELSKNAKRQSDGSRTREWEGLAWIDDINEFEGPGGF
jgi:hypothetical protein